MWVRPAMMELNLTSSFMVTDKVEYQLREELRRMGSGAKVRIPDERLLAQKYGVSRKSLRIALDRLRADNLIRTIPRKGTFFIPPPQKISTVHLICTDQMHLFSMTAANVASSLLKSQGYGTNLSISPDPVSEWEFITRSGKDAVGAVLIGGYSRKTLEHLVRISGFPLVSIGDMSESFRGPAICDNVIPANQEKMFAATDHLIRQGHRRIALALFGPAMVWSKEMKAGYLQAFEAHGLEARSEWILHFPLKSEIGSLELYEQKIIEGLEPMEEWSGSKTAPTALVLSGVPEVELRDMQHRWFRDIFPSEAIVITSFPEILQISYTGTCDMTAVCTSMREIVDHALRLLLRPRAAKETPIREVLEQTKIFHRRNGTWAEE